MRVLCIRPIDVILYEQSPSWKWLRKVPGWGPPSQHRLSCCYYYYYSLLPCILHIRCIGCSNPLSAATKLRWPAICAFVIVVHINQGRRLRRAGGLSPPRKKEKRKKERKERKKEKRVKKRRNRKEGNYKCQITTYKVLFFQFFNSQVAFKNK